MFIRRKNPLEPVGGTETPESIYCSRRTWLRTAGLVGAGLATAGGYLGWRRYRGSDQEVIESGEVAVPVQDDATRLASFFPMKLDERFQYERPETNRADAARYTNFYEFSSTKSSWRYVDDFQPYPWTLQVGGLCRNPFQLDLTDFHQQYAADLVERQYRHRCVETWAMAVPWTGVPLAKLITQANPLAEATHVKFVSFLRPDEASHQRNDSYPWPYVEGLTLPEAANELTLVASGIYGQPILKQHGAPLRLVVPWKYGFKSIKSVERIEFVKEEPATFWTTIAPDAYPFQSNVEPDVPVPWPQHTERMLGTGEIYPTQLYNGYGDYVAKLYTA